MLHKFEAYRDNNKESINHPVFKCSHSRMREYGHFSIQPVYIGQSDEGTNEICHYGDYTFDGQCVFNNLVISCQYGLNDNGSVNHEIKHPYAFDCEYQYTNFGIDSIDKTMMKAKFLERISRGYETLCKDEGYPETFSEYVLYLARVLGIKEFVLTYDNEKTFTRLNKMEFRHWVQDELNK